ncbi:twin-arginine translocase TatA/TatE family subunit [Saccharolobus solfataricus]|uniref:twin-arginine translocase TatA/TatE family subunit n=1 Tax=Saccharolobus solfataricus TaxID=2287 RepID=UPI0007B54E5C|nr:twin-arginine translocase TatA/TatE family subunit [Saccharolobus solfataricus]
MLDSPNDIIIILVVIAVLFFGSSKIPELFRALGRSMGEFKKGQLEAEMEMRQMMSSSVVEKRGNSESVDELEKKIAELKKQLEALKQSKKA